VLVPQEYERELAAVKRDLNAREADLEAARKMADEMDLKVNEFPNLPMIHTRLPGQVIQIRHALLLMMIEGNSR
jgi:hypothetical protein